MGKPLGWSLILRGKTWYVKHRITPDKSQVLTTTKEHDKEKALGAAIQIVNDARVKLSLGDIRGRVREDIKIMVSPEIDRLSAIEEEKLLGIKLDEVNPRLATLWKFGDTMYGDTGVYAKFAKDNTPNYYQTRRSAYKRFFEYLQSEHDIQRIKSVTKEHIAQYYEAIRPEYSNNTMSYIDISIRSLYNFLKKQYGISVEYPEVQYRQEVQPLDESMVLTDDHIKRITEVLVNHPNSKTHYRLFFLLLHTGARKSEGLNILWNSVSFETKTIRIKVNHADASKGITRSYLKTKNSNRVVPMSPILLDTLKQWKEQDGDYPYIIPTTADRNAYTQHKVNQMLQKIVPNWHLHMLRHTWITRCLSAGITPVSVAKVAGDTLDMILKVYYHYIPTTDYDNIFQPN